MTVVMLVLSVALPLLEFTFWSYMGTVSAVLLTIATGIYFFDSGRQKETKKDVKTKTKNSSVKKESENSTASSAHTGYFSHNY